MPQLASISGLQPNRSCSLSNLIDLNNHLNNRQKHRSNWSLLAKRALNIEKCLNLLRNPCEDNLLPLAKRLCQLKHQLLESDQILKDFINGYNGIDLLFDTLRKSESIVQPSFVGVYLQLEVINCLRTIMESPLGIERIISQNNEYAEKLATALNTNNCTVKKQIFDLLSALCMYNKEGHYKSLQALQLYQSSKGLRHRFQILIDELKSVKNIEYKTSLMAFINCLIISADNVSKRTEIRNELIGLKLLDVVSSLKKDEDRGDLSLQCDVFEEQRISDESLPQDVNSHQDVFYSILKQISGNDKCKKPFLHLLQHLLSIEYNDQDLSAIIWDSAETLVHRSTTLIECKEDAEKLLKIHQTLRGTSNALSNGWVPNSLNDSPFHTTPSNNKSRNTDDMEKSSISSTSSQALPVSMRIKSSVIPTPPPPPPPLTMTPNMLPNLIPPPPPPFPSHLNGSSHSPPNNFLTPHSTSLLCMPNGSPVNSCNGSPVLSRKLPQQEIPKPKNKMKSINWSKIPSEKVISTNRPNIWSLIASQHESDNSKNLDFTELEDLFCQPTNASAPNSCPGSPRLPRRPVSSEISVSPYNSLERKVIKRQSGEFQTPNELTLLDGKKSLNVNIFIKQHRGSTDEIIKMISDGKHKEIGAERLRNLLKILPETNEIQMLTNNDSEAHRMPIAERFLFNLIKIPHYQLKIEGMLLKEDFESNVAYLEPAIDVVCSASDQIKQSKSLHEIMYLILVSGNFLNSGGYAGNAAGFKMMALLKLPDIRANKPGVNLIHYVAMQAEKKGICNFTQELPSLEEASKVSIENLKIEVKTLSEKISKIKNQISKHENDSPLHREMNDFLNSSERKVKKLMTAIDSQLNAIRIEIAEFLCEDLEQFKLEECFRIFHSFCQRFKLAVDENERRRENEMKLEARKSNSHLKRFSNITNSLEAENLFTEINPMQSMSSSLSNSMTNSFNADTKLKRRSRRSSQDDELHAGLMEFLKTANDLGTNDMPIFGATFRRMGSGRRSRSSNASSDVDLSRDRNTELCNKNKDKIDENSDINIKDDYKCNDSCNISIRSQKTNAHDIPSDDELNKKKDNFNRFSPLRKTFSYKQTELESKFGKRLNDIKIITNDTNNNHIEDIKADNISYNSKTKITSPNELRVFWETKENNFNDISNGISRPKKLHLMNHHSSHPTAVITPTKLVRSPDDEEKSLLLSPVMSSDSDLETRSSRLPRRMSINSPQNITIAAIVAPLQSKGQLDEKSTSSLPLKSKLPVRKNQLTRLPLQKKKDNDRTVAFKTGIPTPSRATLNRQIAIRSREMPQMRTYRSPSTVSRTNLTSDLGSVASMRRSSQLLPPSRSFMKQTSASAAKTRSHYK